MANPNPTAGANEGFERKYLMDFVNEGTKRVKEKLAAMKEQGSNISIADMFEMQMEMNALAQVSEMSTSVVSASNTAIGAMARGVKG